MLRKCSMTRRFENIFKTLLMTRLPFVSFEFDFILVISKLSILLRQESSI